MISGKKYKVPFTNIKKKIGATVQFTRAIIVEVVQELDIDRMDIDSFGSS